ncbi:hypothetical protein QQ045_018069 [Rhodiola kirilowii]
MAGGDKRIRIDDDGVDRITELPVNLKVHILDCLSIKDAVATSVLSSKWRYCWTGLRKLVFDKEFWKFGEDSTVLEHARAIDRVLMRHSGPIREFILFIPDLKDKRMDINMWLHVLSNNGVQKIEINAFDYKDGLFPIPSGLFTCHELEELSLCRCTLTLPSDFKGFKNLTSLSLNCIYIAPGILESLISGCLLLETLSLKDMVPVRSIEALNLKSFYYEDLTSESIIFKDIPNLTRVSLLSTSEDRISRQKTYSTLEQLCSLFRITEFTFDFLLLGPLSENCLSSTLTPLENLKSLTLRSIDLCLSSDVLFTLYLMGSAPNLRNLTLHLDSRVWCDDDRKLQRDAAKLLKAEAKKPTSYNNLQTIKINGFVGLLHESLLIKLLQSRCQKLKSIIIER